MFIFNYRENRHVLNVTQEALDYLMRHLKVRKKHAFFFFFAEFYQGESVNKVETNIDWQENGVGGF